MPAEPAKASAPVLPDGTHSQILLAYAEWLHYERRIRCHLMGWDERLVIPTAAGNFHFPIAGRWGDVPPPASRAIFVMQAVGVDLATVRSWEEAAHG